MRPRAGHGAVEVIAAGLGGKFGARLAADAMAENRVALEVESLVVVLDQDVLGGPFAVDELSHSISPARFPAHAFWQKRRGAYAALRPLHNHTGAARNRGMASCPNNSCACTTSSTPAPQFNTVRKCPAPMARHC